MYTYKFLRLAEVGKLVDKDKQEQNAKRISHDVHKAFDLISRTSTVQMETSDLWSDEATVNYLKLIHEKNQHYFYCLRFEWRSFNHMISPVLLQYE